MSELLNVEIKKSLPERVYVFPQKLTTEEIRENVEKLHTIANEEADRTIYCLFDELGLGAETKFEVCFPVTHLDLKKYSVDDFKILPRHKVISAEFKADFSKLSEAMVQLKQHAESKGYKTYPPYTYLFILHKKSLIPLAPQKFTMEIHIPVEEV